MKSLKFFSVRTKRKSSVKSSWSYIRNGPRKIDFRWNQWRN